NTDVMIVPYKGASNVLTDLIGGQIDLAIETTSVTFGHVHDGKLRPLGVTTAERLPDLPDVPTMIEDGVPDFIASSWTGMTAPAGAPQAVISRLNTHINARLKSPELQHPL